MLSILGMGAAHPKTIIDNKFLEDLATGTTAEWINQKIGIHTRATTLPLSYIRDTRNQEFQKAYAAAEMSATDLALGAAKQALDRAGIRAKDVGLVVSNCCTPVNTVPSEGQRLAKLLGIEGKVFEVFTACPVFALHTDFLRNFKEEKLPEYILCVSTATLTQNVNYNDRTDGAIWGDGAAAWVISAKHPGKVKVLDSYFMADPTRSNAVVVDRLGYFHQDGRAVRDFSVRQTVRLIKQLEEKYQIDWSKDVFIGHQANATMLEQIRNNREIPPDNHWHNVSTIGNQAGASAPAVLAEHWPDLKPKQKIIVAVVGAGLSWGSLLLEAV